jgi:hypothetical protein
MVFLLLLVLSQSWLAIAQENRAARPKDTNSPVGRALSNVRNAVARKPVAAIQNAPARQPVVINLNRPSAGRNNQAFHPVQQKVTRPPSYGQVQWQAKPQTRPQAVQQPVRMNQGTVQLRQRPAANQVAEPAFKAANVIHHHPYEQGYVRKKLQTIGVKTAPRYITDRAEIVATDRTHSTIHFPQKGPDNGALRANFVTSRHYNDDLVRHQMNVVNDVDYMRRVVADNAKETKSNYYYWHKDKDFNYCHYIDGSGYHWYGWYVGDRCFWTRNYGGRWWWYDADFDRWNFWNDGFWWWQDPYHVGDLYCYNNDAYIPTNSADDQIVVTSTDQPSSASYNSPDGTRTVKVVAATQDAFLYDTANPPTFDPIYLASGAQNVQFSDTKNGRPLEIILKLNDGSFDMFDGQGTPYNPDYSGTDSSDTTP